MIIYYLITLAAALLAELFCRLGNKNKRSRWVVFVLIIVLFSFFAGARAATVGTDTRGYGISAYNTANAGTIGYFFFDSAYKSWSPLAKLVMWLSANMGTTSFSYFFCLEALAVIPVLIASSRLTTRWFPLAVVVFGIMFYPMSFNIMRQMISMGFILLCFERLVSRKLLGSVLSFLMALGFHNSAYIGLLIYPVYFIAISKSFSLFVKVALILTVSLAGLVLARPLLDFVSGVTGYFAAYVSGSAVVDGGGLRTGLELVAIALGLSMLAIIFLRGRELGEQWRCVNGPLVLLVFFGIAVYFVSLISFWLYRISFYFIIFSVPTIPLIAREVPRTPERRIYVFAVVISLILVSFDYYYICKFNEVVPYEFSTLLF